MAAICLGLNVLNLCYRYMKFLRCIPFDFHQLYYMQHAHKHVYHMVKFPGKIKYFHSLANGSAHFGSLRRDTATAAVYKNTGSARKPRNTMTYHDTGPLSFFNSNSRNCFSDNESRLTHCGLVTPYGDIDLGLHRLRLWLVAWLPPSHYLNQCWLIISKVQWHSF